MSEKGRHDEAGTTYLAIVGVLHTAEKKLELVIGGNARHLENLKLGQGVESGYLGGLTKFCPGGGREGCCEEAALSI